MFACKCGQEYELNGSLYNHIRLQHNKDIKGFKTETKLGRPRGKGQKTIKKDKPKVLPKILICKCGKVLKSDGALSNHIKLKHKNHPDYQTIKKKQGRKPKGFVQQENVISQQGLGSQETQEIQQFTQEHGEAINTTIEGPTQNIFQNVNTTKSLQQIYQTHEDQESEIVQEQTQCSDDIQVGECQQEQNAEFEDYDYYDQFQQQIDFNNKYSYGQFNQDLIQNEQY
ncbi:hypothetical protein ABPG72_004925 [Tetrahymena utriculariae]